MKIKAVFKLIKIKEKVVSLSIRKKTSDFSYLDKDEYVVLKFNLWKYRIELLKIWKDVIYLHIFNSPFARWENIKF